ncbi:NADPH:quinone oxidoreductase family protein [Henriciella barbarensis]|uniref:NADPH:quinone oxidoreductase family protein n=1 Tax=Henriciella barbarensis TaxID=86342 RepID=A0A399QTI6_9PROT|nr:NADPH:quinone oxidoreductase family protein [Henriciella barbarensis]RIJ22276.1 NADPH:quinone oxidoreductase family protein [Henriciella barbarensis]
MSVPQKMRALQVEELGENYKGVRLNQTDVPAPGPGEILLKIRAGSLGFPDLLMTQGGYQHKPDLPFIPGGDVSGEVAALGEGVSEFVVGDRVVTSRLGGAFAEYNTYSAKSVRKIPDHLDFAAAASVGSAYLTAYVSLVRRANIQPGEWLLVHGAAGGVGLAAVDLGKHLGAKVIAAASRDDKLQVIKDKYAPDAVINYTGGFREKVKEITNGGADIIYDPVGGDVFAESVRCIAFDGRLLVVGFASGRIPEVKVNMPLIKGFSVVGVRAGEYGRQFPEKGRENMEAVWKMIEDKSVTPHAHAVYSLDDWRKAFAEMEERRVVGRVIIDPSL